jgi:ABC-2 type transport system ATP-binding protein
MDHGKVIAQGTPQQLIATVGGEDIVEFAVSARESAGPSVAADELAAGTSAAVEPERGSGLHAHVDVERLKAIPGVQSHRVEDALHQLSVSELHTSVPRIFAALEEQGLHLTEFRTHSATLEDVFVRLTGRNLRDE